MCLRTLGRVLGPLPLVVSGLKWQSARTSESMFTIFMQKAYLNRVLSDKPSLSLFRCVDKSTYFSTMKQQVPGDDI